MMYNNTIENAKISGKAQARADAFTQSQYAQSSAFQNSMGTIGSALSASGQGFASAFDASFVLCTAFIHGKITIAIIIVPAAITAGIILNTYVKRSISPCTNLQKNLYGIR